MPPEKPIKGDTPDLDEREDKLLDEVWERELQDETAKE